MKTVAGLVFVYRPLCRSFEACNSITCTYFNGKKLRDCSLVQVAANVTKYPVNDSRIFQLAIACVVTPRFLRNYTLIEVDKLSE